MFDQGFGIALDSVRRAEVAGLTLINQLPAKNPFRAAAAPGSTASPFVTKLTQSNGITGALSLLLGQPWASAPHAGAIKIRGGAGL